jgi:hypothetical protein
MKEPLNLIFDRLYYRPTDFINSYQQRANYRLIIGC